MFSVLDEYNTWFKERFEFILVELDQLSIIKRVGNDSFFRSLAKRQELLSRIVRRTYELQKRLDFSRGLSWDCLKSMEEIENSYYVLPGLLNDTLQSFLNRRGREISKYAPRKPRGAIVSLSSVHPTYAVSILSLECLSSALHYKLKPIFGDKFQHSTPLTRLWESFQYSTKLLDYIEPVLDLTKDNGRGISVGDLLYLSGINIPRWATHHIRVAGSILAHEHFHHVNYLVIWCSKYIGQAKLTDNRLKELFGSKVFDMSQAFNDLVGRLKGFLGKRYKSKRLLRLIIPSIADELICDIAGFVLVGPAFSYALTLLLLPSISLDVNQIIKTHPLPNVRIALQIELLKHFKFPASANRLERFSQPIMEFVRSPEYRERDPDFARKFEKWITDEDTLRFFFWFSEFLLSEPITDFSEKEHRPSFKGYCFDKDEEKKWEKKIGCLIEEISKNNVHFGLFDNNLSPIDILNAFWLAKEKEYIKSGGKSTAHYLQLGWREWLSKYQKTHFLDNREG